MLTLDTSFAQNYRIDLLHDLPAGGSPHYYYPGASTRGGRDGIMLRVWPEGGEPWTATFAFNGLTQAVSGVYSMPSPRHFCVVAMGAGYVASAASPLEWYEISAWPVFDVRPIPAAGLIVFATSTVLMAYGPDGIKWRTEDVTLDDLTITEVTDTHIRGVGSHYARPEGTSVVVKLENGTHEGGVDPPVGQPVSFRGRASRIIQMIARRVTPHR